MNNFILEQQQKSEKIARLTDFINSQPPARELKRAIAVKMALQGTPYEKITHLLVMHKTCISRWKQRFESGGIEGIKLGYQGAKSYLTPEQKAEVITWLKTREYWNFEELVNHLDEHYQVIYKSKQSYYELLSVAKISWKKSHALQPKA
jgi:putative transposase